MLVFLGLSFFFLHLSICPFIHPSVSPSIYTSIHPYICLPIHLYTHNFKKQNYLTKWKYHTQYIKYIFFGFKHMLKYFYYKARQKYWLREWFLQCTHFKNRQTNTFCAYYLISYCQWKPLTVFSSIVCDLDIAGDFSGQKGFLLNTLGRI